MAKEQKQRGYEMGSRERLLRVAAELFAAHGYHATSMKDLEQATGLGRSSLYYQFSSKEELLFEIITRYLRELIDYGGELLETDMEPQQRLREFSQGVMQIIARDLPEFTVCFREVHSVGSERRGELLDLHRRYEQIWTNLLQAGVNDGVFMAADMLTVKALLGMHHYSYIWLKPDGRRRPNEVADAFIDLALNGLLRHRGEP